MKVTIKDWHVLLAAIIAIAIGLYAMVGVMRWHLGIDRPPICRDAPALGGKCNWRHDGRLEISKERGWIGCDKRTGHWIDIETVLNRATGRGQ